MRTLTTSYDDGIHEVGKVYDIGLNDSRGYIEVTYLGTKQMYGKPMMVFQTKDDEQLIVNQSYLTHTVTHNKGE
jgi:sporulation protein YlmC with PRC-barrel domain|tara:strand:- start:291 stop:512 length:222 start_codon:yes stop_codon:yes gene_type:complete